ncbi:DUF423 domain-containing protein [Devosia submarina]|uniref:DUF423 domain-containing protein n=1 Tax=Devosia submarina TaxID=1173082 RepID=UPI000D3CBC25|nr:DUF423 domain-containing protein [Devosia submarina]
MQPEENPTTPARLGARHRLLIAAGGIAGAVGVAAAAAGSHGESRNLSAIALICLAHGPALLALGLAGAGRLFWWSAILLAGGTVLFAADLAVREWMNRGLFPGAAPLGGMGMIVGWLALVVAAAAGKRN